MPVSIDIKLTSFASSPSGSKLITILKAATWVDWKTVLFLLVRSLVPDTLTELLLPPKGTSLWKKKRSGVLLQGRFAYWRACTFLQIQSSGFFDTFLVRREEAWAKALTTLKLQ